MNPNAPWSFEIRAILPVLTHACNGDILYLYSLHNLHSTNSAEVMVESCIGGGTLFIFPQQTPKGYGIICSSRPL